MCGAFYKKKIKMNFALWKEIHLSFMKVTEGSVNDGRLDEQTLVYRNSFMLKDVSTLKPCTGVLRYSVHVL